MKPKRFALMGLDGSGKSTVIDRLKTDPTCTDFVFAWVRWEPFLLKPAYWLVNKRVGYIPKAQHSREERKESSSAKGAVKRSIFRNGMMRAVWTMAALLDYFLQFYAKVTKFLVSGKCMVFDRYYFDLFVDQGLNVGFSPEKISRLVKKCQWMFPRLEQAVYIRVSPEICYSRKDDIDSMEYLVQRFAVYETLSKDLGWKVIDGEEAADQVYESIKSEILSSSKRL